LDWHELMSGLERWLWESPCLDVPNYAWAATGLALLVVVLYLAVLWAGHKEEAEALPEDDEAERSLPEVETPLFARPTAQSPPPEEASAAQGQEGEPAEEPASERVSEPAPCRAPEAVPGAAPPEEVELVPPEGWIERLRAGLSKTQDKFTKNLAAILAGRKLSPEAEDDLEELLITSDLGVKTSMDLLEKIRQQASEKGIESAEGLQELLRENIKDILEKVEAPLIVPQDHKGPFVIMVTGVNGTGKTTTIGKLALRFRDEGKSVLLAAADTFRAAAIQQLEVWADRAGCPVIRHKEGADPSAVAFDAIKAAIARHADVVIIDTAGRLHTKVNLMEELKKVKRITGRELAGAPHEVMLVLDATTGQNAVQQTETFNRALEVTGLVMTKLDGTAKGGIIVAVSDRFGIPIRFIGVGEKIYDLQPFKAGEFVDALF